MTDFDFQPTEDINHAREVCRTAIQQNGSDEANAALRVIDDVIAELDWRKNMGLDAEEFNRNEIAKEAMQGILANSAECCVNLTPKQLAHLSYDIADTMIAEGRKK